MARIISTCPTVPGALAEAVNINAHGAKLLGSLAVDSASLCHPRPTGRFLRVALRTSEHNFRRYGAGPIGFS